MKNNQLVGASEAFHTAGKALSEQQAARNRHVNLTASISPANISSSLLFTEQKRSPRGPCFNYSPHVFLLLQPEEEGVKEKWEEGSCWCLIHHVGPPEECLLPSVHLLDSMFTLAAGVSVLSPHGCCH